MVMRVSLDGSKPIAASKAVIFRGETPIAVAYMIDPETVVYVDAIRDPEFVQTLHTLGVPFKNVPIQGPTIKGNV